MVQRHRVARFLIFFGLLFIVQPAFAATIVKNWDLMTGTGTTTYNEVSQVERVFDGTGKSSTKTLIMVSDTGRMIRWINAANGNELRGSNSNTFSIKPLGNIDGKNGIDFSYSFPGSSTATRPTINVTDAATGGIIMLSKSDSGKGGTQDPKAAAVPGDVNSDGKQDVVVGYSGYKPAVVYYNGNSGAELGRTTLDSNVNLAKITPPLTIDQLVRETQTDKIVLSGSAGDGSVHFLAGLNNQPGAAILWTTIGADETGGDLINFNNDVVVQKSQGGVIHGLDPATGNILWTITSGSGCSDYINLVNLPDDVTGTGKKLLGTYRESFLGAPRFPAGGPVTTPTPAPITCPGGGAVELYDAATGQPVFSLPTNISAITSIGDVDGDGVPELVIGGGDTGTKVQVYAKGALLVEKDFLPDHVTGVFSTKNDINVDGKYNDIIIVRDNGKVEADSAF